MIERAFFERDPLTCARELIGCELVWNECAGIVVETEAYTGMNDEASHTFSRPSARAFIVQHRAGAAYVYFNYGMYWLFNALVKGGAENGFVLIRAIEPTRGLALMRQRRSAGRRTPVEKAQALCSGPGKLAQAFAIDGRDHGRDLCAEPAVGFRPAPAPVAVVTDVRIGISKAAHLPWRFLLEGSAFVSAPPSRQAHS